jgi:hypothetical protein
MRHKVFESSILSPVRQAARSYVLISVSTHNDKIPAGRGGAQEAAENGIWNAGYRTTVILQIRHVSGYCRFHQRQTRLVFSSAKHILLLLLKTEEVTRPISLQKTGHGKEDDRIHDEAEDHTGMPVHAK